MVKVMVMESGHNENCSKNCYSAVSYRIIIIYIKSYYKSTDWQEAKRRAQTSGWMDEVRYGAPVANGDGS